MSNMNQHYRFWVAYYSDLDRQEQLSSQVLSKHNEVLVAQQWESSHTPLPLAEQTLLMQVKYPGLLVGLGNTHNSRRTSAEKDNEKTPEISLGITLDLVTGLPFLPGSSVKGVLRSAFVQNADYIAALLQGQGSEFSPTETFIRDLEEDIFGPRPKGKQRPEGEGRDIFLDAYPVQTGEKGRLLGAENITPHRSKDPAYEGLQNPTPLNLLKVIPGVVFCFRFVLRDSELKGGTVTAAQKQKLFETILSDLGAGAKTSTGFGLLEPLGSVPVREKTLCWLQMRPTTAEQDFRKWLPIAKKTDTTVAVGDTVLGKVSDHFYNREKTFCNKVKICFCSPLRGYGILHISEIPNYGGDLVKEFPIGTEIRVKIITKDEKGRINLSLCQTRRRK